MIRRSHVGLIFTMNMLVLVKCLQYWNTRNKEGLSMIKWVTHTMRPGRELGKCQWQTCVSETNNRQYIAGLAQDCRNSFVN